VSTRSAIPGRTTPTSGPRGRRTALTLLVAAGLAILPGRPALSTPGDLDPSFGMGGVAAPGLPYRPSDLALQSDGKVLAAGIVPGPADVNALFVARFTTTGSLDPSFDGDGVARFDQLTPGGRSLVGPMANGLAVQPDGKILVAGLAFDAFDVAAPERGLVLRLNPNGSLDSGFGTDGVVDPPGVAFRKVRLQADGKIVLVGQTRELRAPDFLVARLNADGSFDTTLGGDGIVTTNVFGIDFGTDVAVQADGKIVVVGAIDNDGSRGDWGVLRYNPDGTLDPTFGGDGIVQTDFGGSQTGSDVAWAVALQGDGHLVAAGQGRLEGGGPSCSLARYNPDGTLDPTFDGDGKLMFGTCASARGLGLQQNGKIVVAGDSALVRRNPDGTPDAGFGTSGAVTTPVSGLAALTIEASGRILVAGQNSTGLALAAYQGDPPPPPPTPRYVFTGFFQPIDNDGVNVAKAGRTIPVIYRVTLSDGTPLSDPAHFVRLTSQAGATCAGAPADQVETYAGSSGLQYLGDGTWQFNWKTPKSYGGQCRTMTLSLADGSVHTAQFSFR
jgi:uncharacterized delta-60 repeat protein